MNRAKYVGCVALVLLLALALFELNESLSPRLSVTATEGGDVERSVSAAAEKPRELPTRNPAAARPNMVEAYGSLPLHFEANQGQTDGRVKFLARGQGFTLFLTPDEAVFSLRRRVAARAAAAGTGSIVAPGSRRTVSGRPPSAADDSPSVPPPAVLRMSLAGANLAAVVSSEGRLPGRVNYLLGNDPSKWRTNVRLFGKVRYEAVYPGIDLVYYGNQRQLEFDFVVAPGANPHQIRLHIEGAADRKLDSEGNLVLALDGGEVRFHKPLIYQQRNASREEVAGVFVLGQDNEIGFEVGAYDASRPLVIDPVLLYSTYLGGSSQEIGMDIAVDSSGRAYITGWTESTNFPLSSSPYDSTLAGGKDVFVTRLEATGALSYSTYLGGSLDDEGRGIAVDANGNAYVAGVTSSTDYPYAPRPCGPFPFAPCPYQTTNAGGRDAFITKLNSSGSALVYSTYLGGPSDDFANGIAVDASNAAFVTGMVYDGGFPTTAGAFQTAPVASCSPVSGYCFGDVFVAKLSPSGRSLDYSTYLSGLGTDIGTDVAIDSSGNAYVAGTTFAANFPVTAGALQTSFVNVVCDTYWYTACSDAFVTKLNSSGSGLIYSTYLGGNSTDEAHGIQVYCTAFPRNGCFAHVVGWTASANFPTANAFQSTLAGSDAFVSKLSDDGSSLVYSTFLGGSGSEEGHGIDISSNSAFVTGYTTSADFPAFNTMQGFGGSSDVFLTKFSSSGGLVFSTFFGGNRFDSGNAIAVDATGNAHITGNTNSTNLPVLNAVQPTFGTTGTSGMPDAFVAKISPELTPSANAGPDQLLLETVPGATPFTLSGSGSDPDNDPLTYEWRDAANVIVGTTLILNLTRPTGVHVFTLYVRDNGGGVGTDSVSITIHRPPVANAGPDQIVEASSNAMGVFTLNGSASSDPDGNAITYDWRDAANNVVGTTALVILTRPLGSYTFTLVVTDSHGVLSLPDSVNIVVQDTTPPTVQVTRPNGGDKLFMGTPYVIEWTASDNGVLSFFDVFVSLNGGTTYSPIPECTNVSGALRSCTWAAPGPLNSTTRIRVKATDGAGLTAQDASNSNFSIVAGAGTITVTAPNTAVDWGIGSTQQIKWNHNLGLNSYMKIEVSRDSGSTWSVINASFKNTGASASVFNWLVTGPITDGALIRVSWANGPTTTDNSNLEFIISDPYIVVAAPATTATNYGYETSRTQTWTTNLGPLDKVNVLMSTDGGATFPLALASNIVASNKTAPFTTPTLAAPVTSARIRVVWVANAAIQGTSPTNFLVQPAFVRVTNPNFSNHTWTIGANQTITWTSNLGAAENVLVELSLDGGQTFNIVVLGTTPSDGTQAVVVQAAWATQMGRLRITWLENSLVTDISNQDFRIQ